MAIKHAPIHGLRAPNEAFFHHNPKVLGRQFGQINFGAFRFGIFGRFISTHFGTVSPMSMFYYFCTKINLYIENPNIFLILRFEFGLQRIRDLAIVCPQSVLLSSILHRLKLQGIYYHYLLSTDKPDVVFQAEY